MKHLSFLTICIMACFVMSCSSDSDNSEPNPGPNPAEETKYTPEDFMALYHGTPQVLANIVTGGKVEMDKWNDLLSLFVEEEPTDTRGPIGQVLSLAQFAGKCYLVCKDANLDIYMRLKSKGISYQDMYNNVEPEHRSGYANAEEWEIAMNQGKITNPHCFSDLATAYATVLQEDEGYNQYRYKILANTSVELAEEGVNVIASFDSDVSNAKNAYDFVNASLTGDNETVTSKISGLISETGGDISDASLYAFKAYLDYCLENRETSFTWIPKNDTYFSGYWYEKIDETTEYEYDIFDENNMVNETMFCSKWEKDNDKAIGDARKMSCTLYCGKEYIFYIKENGKVTPYRIIHTAGEYVTSENAFFYMIEVGGTTKRLWKRAPYYSHEKQEVPPVMFAETYSSENYFAYFNNKSCNLQLSKRDEDGLGTTPVLIGKYTVVSKEELELSVQSVYGDGTPFASIQKGAKVRIGYTMDGDSITLSIPNVFNDNLHVTRNFSSDQNERWYFENRNFRFDFTGALYYENNAYYYGEYSWYYEGYGMHNCIDYKTIRTKVVYWANDMELPDGTKYNPHLKEGDILTIPYVMTGEDKMEIDLFGTKYELTKGTK